MFIMHNDKKNEQKKTTTVYCRLKCYGSKEEEEGVGQGKTGSNFWHTEKKYPFSPREAKEKKSLTLQFHSCNL